MVKGLNLIKLNFVRHLNANGTHSLVPCKE